MTRHWTSLLAARAYPRCTRLCTAQQASAPAGSNDYDGGSCLAITARCMCSTIRVRGAGASEGHGRTAVFAEVVDAVAYLRGASTMRR